MEENEIVFIKSEKGKDVLLKSGYKYYFRDNRKNGTNWRCVNSLSCSASITIDKEKKGVLRNSAHMCKPNQFQNKVDICLHNCREKVVKTMKSIQRIFEKEFEALKDEASLSESKKIPEFKTLKDALYKRRYKALMVEKSCFGNIDDITLPPIISEDFLISDKYNIYIFATPLARETTQKTTSFLGDGTFKVTPSPFFQ